MNNPSLIAEMFNVVFRLNRQTEKYLYMLALTTKGKPLGTPSKQDIESYNCLKETGKLIGINVLDSIIVGDNYYSFAENRI